MMKSLLTLFLGILLSAGAFNLQAQNEWDLQACFDYAIENNLQVKRQEINTRYNETLVKQAKDDKLPNLNGQVSNDFSFGR